MDKSLRDIAHLREGYRYVTALKQELFYTTTPACCAVQEEQTQSVLMGLPAGNRKKLCFRAGGWHSV